MLFCRVTLEVLRQTITHTSGNTPHPEVSGRKDRLLIGLQVFSVINYKYYCIEVTSWFLHPNRLIDIYSQ